MLWRRNESYVVLMIEKGVDTRTSEGDKMFRHIVLGVPGRKSWSVLAWYRFDPKSEKQSMRSHIHTHTLAFTHGYLQSMMNTMSHIYIYIYIYIIHIHVAMGSHSTHIHRHTHMHRHTHIHIYA